MKTYPELIRWFRRNEKEFLLLDDLYSFSNLFQAVLIGIKQLLLIRGTRFEFGLKDLSLLFYEELQRTVFGPMMLEFNLYYYFIANLKKRKIKIKNFILTFENMFHEKALLIGLKEFYPQTKVIGYQHALLYPMLLCLSLPHEKGRSMPMPDKIVCCGQMSKEILSNEGFSCDKLLPGPALRHNYLHQLRGSSPQKEYTYDKKRVLVAGIEDPHITLELLTKVYIALKQESDIETYFIPHPNMKKTEMDNLFKNSLIKKDFFKFTNGPIKDSLLNTDCLIASTTAAIFDALCLGVPVIRLHRETDIIIDPLDWLDEDSSYFLPSAAGVNVSKVGFASNNIQRLKPWSFKATSPSELKEMFKQIKRLSKAQRDEFSDIGQEMLHKYFSPVNEESYEVFV
jgi:surface carbohydrate biosynthesis protein (TIGR04326 family)